MSSSCSEAPMSVALTEKEKAEQENLKSAISDHCKRNNHVMDWEKAEWDQRTIRTIVGSRGPLKSGNGPKDNKPGREGVFALTHLGCSPPKTIWQQEVWSTCQIWQVCQVGHTYMKQLIRHITSGDPSEEDCSVSQYMSRSKNTCLIMCLSKRTPYINLTEKVDMGQLELSDNPSDSNGSWPVCVFCINEAVAPERVQACQICMSKCPWAKYWTTNCSRRLFCQWAGVFVFGE